MLVVKKPVFIHYHISLVYGHFKIFIDLSLKALIDFLFIYQVGYF